jgi:hypothetical protein
MANDVTNQIGISLFGQGGIVYENIDTNKTLALVDNGIVQRVIADAITITLPATTAGACFTILNGGVPASTSIGAGSGGDASALVTVAPNAVDQIAGLNFTAADNKAALNTKATSKVGGFITLVGDGTNGWNVLFARGIWARQA